jgi:hypothetical protein
MNFKKKFYSHDDLKQARKREGTKMGTKRKFREAKDERRKLRGRE